ncbi:MULTISPECIES: hypothetical protein [Rhizobium]|nr:MULTISPECIES: hypothetical protein [Rhizobium]
MSTFNVVEANAMSDPWIALDSMPDEQATIQRLKDLLVLPCGFSTGL